jgi:2-oxoglutarate dehydrogenase E1 component
VLPDTQGDPAKVKRVLLCTGKIYFELDEYRREQKREDVAIVRLEQLYPLRRDLLEAALKPYAEGTPVVWVQEEPANMGAWIYLRINLEERLFGRHLFSGISRPLSASPAPGSHRRHKHEQAEIIARAFADAQQAAT